MKEYLKLKAHKAKKKFKLNVWVCFDEDGKPDLRYEDGILVFYRRKYAMNYSSLDFRKMELREL